MEPDVAAEEEARASVPSARAHSGMWPHVALLWLLLFSFSWVAGVERGVADADEGALLMQVRQLADDESWWVAYPGSSIDPDQQFVGIKGARMRDGEVAPFGARPVWVGLALVAWNVGGVPMVTMLGIVGVVAAAWSVGRLASMIEPRAAILSFWLTGLASPLAFQSLVLQGHGITTGLAGLALVAVFRARQTSDAGRLVAWVSLAFVSGMAASAIRREVFIFAAALALAGAVEFLRTRAVRPAALLVIPLVGTAAGVALDRWLVTALELGERSLPAASTDSGFVDGRLESFGRFLLPGHVPETGMAMALALGAAVVCIAGAVLYVRNDDRPALVGAAMLAALLLAVRLLVEPTPMIAGIIPAFPLGAAALILGARGARRDPLAQLLLTTFVVFVVITWLTQYPFGGGFEWGSRYLSVGLVAALPLCGVGLVRTWEAFGDSTNRRVLLAATVVLALAPTAMGLAAQRHARITNEANLDAGYALARTIDTEVIISTHQEIPRVDTEHFTSGVIWLFAPRDLGVLLTLLEDSGHDEVVLFTRLLELPQTFLDEVGWEFRDVEIRPENPGTVALGVLAKVAESD
jgi:hypothetical protein